MTKRSIHREPGTGPYKFLAKVVSNSRFSPNSLFVLCPEIHNEHKFHTYNAGHDTVKIPSYDDDVSAYSSGDYIHLIYEESKFTDDKYKLSRVERAQVTMPTDHETIGESSFPKQCPMCGDEAVAVIENPTNESYAGDYSCEVSDDRASWFGFYKDTVYVHPK